MLYGSLEVRNQEITCAVGDGHCKILDQVEFPLTTPQKSLGAAIRYFKNFKKLRALGVSSFGPLDLRVYSNTYGYIMNSSRPHWSNVNLLGTLEAYLKIPVSITTDVNSAAFGEYIHSVMIHKPLMSLVYMQIGKGVGAGIVNEGKFIGSEGSPEIGHIVPKRAADDKQFKGTCPYQGDCIEGLVSTAAFQARFHKSYKQVSKFNPVWDDVAYYIAQSALQSTLFVRPKRIILSGELMDDIELRKVRAQFKKLLNNYLPVGKLDQYITLPTYNSEKLAIMGNISLAKKKYYAGTSVDILHLAKVGVH